MDLAIRTDTYGSGDQSWLGSAHGTDSGVPCTLDQSAFTEGTHFPDGYLISGLPLAKIAASGKYGPYSTGTAEVQTITIDATGGTFTITAFGDATAAIAYNATAATVQAALELLPGIAPGDVVVTGGPGASAAFTLTFGGQYAGLNVAAVTTGAGSLTGGAGTATVATGTAGVAPTSGLETLAGFLFCDVPVPTSGADPVGVLLDHCIVIEANLPVAIDEPAKTDLPTVTYR